MGVDPFSCIVFALIPVFGGVIKGVGRITIKIGKEASGLVGAARAAHLQSGAKELVEFLNRIGVNKSRMLEFARHHANDPRLTQDPFFDDSISDEDLAPSLVARNAFTTRPCRWMYVEKIHGALKN